MSAAGNNPSFLTARDPAPFESVNPHGKSPFVLTCEHAGRAVPERIGDLGIARADMDRHIAWDVGAEGVARSLSKALDAPLVLQPYSRLVIDCNRPIASPECVPPVSDGTIVPANSAVGDAERTARFDAIHTPFHAEIARLLDTRSLSILVAVHSFTPMLALVGIQRPWHTGLLFHRDRAIADMLLPELAARAPECTFAFNEPYSVDDTSDYTIPFHGERRGIPHVLVEIRNDEISDRTGEARWADLFARALAAVEPQAITEARKRDTP